jgi:hypothetical protein
MSIFIGGFEIRIVVGMCGECGFEGEVRVLGEARVCECCIEEPLV